MRTATGIVLLTLALTGCFKKKVIRHIEGDWQCYQVRDPNGLYSDANDHYHFEKQDKRSETPVSYTYYGSDTIQGQYQVLKHGVKVYFIGPFTVGSNDTLNLEDISDNSMVMTRNEYVLYFKR